MHLSECHPPIDPAHHRDRAIARSLLCQSTSSSSRAPGSLPSSATPATHTPQPDQTHPSVAAMDDEPVDIKPEIEEQCRPMCVKVRPSRRPCLHPLPPRSVDISLTERIHPIAQYVLRVLQRRVTDDALTAQCRIGPSTRHASSALRRTPRARPTARDNTLTSGPALTNA